MHTYEDLASLSEYYYKHLCRTLPQWATAVAYYYGVERQVAISKHDASEIVSSLSYKGLEFRYYAGYGTVNLQVLRPYPRISWVDDPYTLQVLSRSECSEILPSKILQAAQYIDSYLRTVFDGAARSNTIAACYGCNMDRRRYQGRLGADRMEPDFPLLDVCNAFADKWLCAECQEMFSLTSPPPQPISNKPAKGERAKMSVSVRFTVLERDRFTCKTCGRSPLSGDPIKLHVDHIYPVSLGGKTHVDNLHTLCNECNLGKSDKVIEQLVSRA